MGPCRYNICNNIMIEVKVRKIGNSHGIVLPREVLSQLKVENGDKLFLVPEPDGFCLTALNLEVAEQMKVAESITKRYRNTLKKLAE